MVCRSIMPSRRSRSLLRLRGGKGGGGYPLLLSTSATVMMMMMGWPTGGCMMRYGGILLFSLCCFHSWLLLHCIGLALVFLVVRFGWLLGWMLRRGLLWCAVTHRLAGFVVHHSNLLRRRWGLARLRSVGVLIYMLENGLYPFS